MYRKMFALALIIMVVAGCGAKPAAQDSAQGTDQTAPVSTVINPVSANANGSNIGGNPAVPLASGQEPAAAAFNVKEHVIYSGPRSEKKVALTFDDGPDAKFTNQILDILKREQVVATFFVTGEHASAHKDVMKRIVENGHEVGNHSWDHQDLTKMDEQQLKDEIDKTDAVIQGFTGRPSTLLRPPYGAISKQVVDHAESNHKLIFWSVDTRDWQGYTSEKIMETFKKELKPGAIILQHSAGGKNGNLSNTVKALPQLIHYLKEHGYEMVTVSNLVP
ncbi:Peptidoglycan-N-acetylglucosamine deacetylase [Paenibacillus konkukensis]|uniref:Peptidoglycan-N-acetylglucosamine deacetylase n=1 Tax=Paenibacillus konkukensis TaxID=2020716 RepID=A0ABY4RGA9_9BACL|nr:polysaccharide deacetylase family protein [Paenibacillus konkukensis]UQZ80890.1 Peptidoglycan-N-acetylglucosamine deacetylase [Paenibacillus konkukensis]